MASVTLLRNLIKKYRIGSKTAPAAPASAKEPIAKANTKHAAFPEFKNQDSDDEKPLQFSRTKANVVGPSQSASKHKGFPKYKGWNSDDEEPLQIPRVKHVTAPPQHHHNTHKHTKSLGSLFQKPKKETSGILPKGNKYGYPQSEFSDASDNDASDAGDANEDAGEVKAVAPVAPVAVAPVAPVTPVTENAKKSAALITKDNIYDKILAVPDDAPKTLRPKRLSATERREKARQVEELAAKMRTPGPKLKSWDELEIKDEIQTGTPITAIKPIPTTKFYEAPEPDITEPINVEHPSVWGTPPPTIEEKAEITANEIIASEGKEWYESGNLVVDTTDFKGEVFDAPKAALQKTDEGLYKLNLDPAKAKLLKEAAANENVVKSMYNQYKLAEAATKKDGIGHFIINGRPVVAIRGFTIRGEGPGQLTTKKTITDYLNKYGIITSDAGGIPYSKVLKGLRSNFIVIRLEKTDKPPPYKVWKAAMKKTFGKNADILP